MNELTLQDFFKRYGTLTTTNFQLIQYAKELKLKPFYYVMRNEIKNLKRLKGNFYAITNIHTTKERGIHHSMIAKINNKYYWFDSYALPPPNEIEILSPLKDIEYYSGEEFRVQDFNQSYCGQISLFSLYKLSKQHKLLHIINSIKSQLQNA